eukprot:g24103.t1
MSVLQDSDLRSDVVAKGAALSACEKVPWTWQRGQLLMKRGPCLVNATSWAQEHWRWPLELLRAAVSGARIAGDTVLWTTAVTGSWRGAVGRLRAMAQRPVVQDTDSFNVAGSACARAAAWEEDGATALGLFLHHGLRRGLVAFGAAIDACESWTLGYTLLQQMRQEQNLPDARLRSCAISAEGCASCTAVIFSCVAAWPRAFQLLQRLPHLALAPDRLLLGSAVARGELAAGLASPGIWRGARVERLGRHLAELVRDLEAAAGEGRRGSQRALHEIAVNCNVSVAGSPWQTKRVLLSADGFSLVDRPGQVTSGTMETELTPWSQVQSPGPEASEPGGAETPRWGLIRWLRAPSEPVRSNLFQAEMQLSDRRITLQFGAAGPPELMKRLWQASQGQGESTGPKCNVQPLIDLLGKCTEGQHGLELNEVFAEPLAVDLSLYEVRKRLRDDEQNPLRRMHEASRAENVTSWSWSNEWLSPGEVKFFEFKQILPGGLGPSDTRVTAVYYLEPDQPEEVVLHKDIPFKDDFLVYTKHIFSQAASGAVCLQIEVGIHWIGSPLKLGLLKPTIRQQSKNETAGSGQAPRRLWLAAERKPDVALRLRVRGSHQDRGGFRVV